MRLSKEQSQAIFDLIREELHSDANRKRRKIKSENRKSEEESVIKFKETQEYKAVMLLSKTFKGTSIDWSKKGNIETLACWMFKPKRQSTYVSFYEERKTIELLAIDCKNLAELKEKLNAHYSLKKKIK